MVLNIVDNFQNKSFLYLCCNKLWVAQNYFAIAAKLSKTIVNKKAKSISVFDFVTLYATNINSFKKCFQKLLILFSSLKPENIVPFLKHLSIGYLRDLEEDT